MPPMPTTKHAIAPRTKHLLPLFHHAMHDTAQTRQTAPTSRPPESAEAVGRSLIGTKAVHSGVECGTGAGYRAKRPLREDGDGENWPKKAKKRRLQRRQFDSDPGPGETLAYFNNTAPLRLNDIAVAPLAREVKTNLSTSVYDEGKWGSVAGAAAADGGGTGRGGGAVSGDEGCAESGGEGGWDGWGEVQALSEAIDCGCYLVRGRPDLKQKQALSELNTRTPQVAHPAP
ncbi:hypothetical protein C8F04DRAFT_1387895 [Mycena alexandri]|uniref:Uncharacterized protein n=1 Tax=Mycena alexandri TaxID=1745969 RepID=A0AAD6TM48_9AGAR|nr:hypothetical protein C8F04DRAFT_1387895 [Mycena alexandri]